MDASCMQKIDNCLLKIKSYLVENKISCKKEKNKTNEKITKKLFLF